MVLALGFAAPDVARSPASLGRWAAEHRLGDAAVGGLAMRLGAVRALHADVVEVLDAVASGRPAERGAVERLNAASAAVPFAPALRIRGGRLEVVDDAPAPMRPTDVLAAVARSTIRLLGSDAERLRRCPACGTFFLATRPDRVWCSASCGNRVRVARHHARRRAG